MSGANKGVQKLIRDSSQNPCPYVHCYAHGLNLVLADVAKRVDLVADTIGLLEAIYAYQSVSTIRHRVFLGSQKRNRRYCQFLSRVTLDGCANMLASITFTAVSVMM